MTRGVQFQLNAIPVSCDVDTPEYYQMLPARLISDIMGDRQKHIAAHKRIQSLYRPQGIPTWKELEDEQRSSIPWTTTPCRFV